ncbi:MAG: hypothetical protein ACPLQO_03970, partial [Desulfotomaculales bacterium]
MMRKESRGFHLRGDSPETDDTNWLKWIIVQKFFQEVFIDVQGPHPRRKSKTLRQIFLPRPRPPGPGDAGKNGKAHRPGKGAAHRKN